MESRFGGSVVCFVSIKYDRVLRTHYGCEISLSADQWSQIA